MPASIDSEQFFIEKKLNTRHLFQKYFFLLRIMIKEMYKKNPKKQLKLKKKIIDTNRILYHCCNHY